MASSYSTDLKLELMVTGEKAGEWGDITNTNLNILQQAIGGYESVAVTNATTAPGNLGENQLRNIAGGQSNVSPYGLGLGQQLYNPMGFLNF